MSPAGNAKYQKRGTEMYDRKELISAASGAHMAAILQEENKDA